MVRLFRLQFYLTYNQIDSNSIAHLELVANARTGDAKQSLFGTLQFTRARFSQVFGALIDFHPFRLYRV